MEKLLKRKNTLIGTNNISALIYGAMLIFWLWLFFNAPYTNDDWDWGLPVGMEQLLTASVNSRYAGNLVIVSITRSRFVKTLFCGLVAWAVPFCISRIDPELEARHRLNVFLFSNLLLLTMNKSVWQQSYGWLAAFANYVTSGLCLVLLYTVLRRYFSGRLPALGAKAAIGLFALVFVSMLFIENLALYFLAVIALCFVIALVQKRDLKYPALMLAAAVLGLVLMFSSPVYGTLLSEGRSVGREMNFAGATSLLDIISSAVAMLAYLLPGMYEVNVGLCLLALLVVSAMLWLQRRGGALVPACFTLLNAVMALMILLNSISGAVPEILRRADGNTHLSIVLFLLLALELLWLVAFGRDREFSLVQCFLWLSTMAVILPLLVTKNSGSRLFYSLYVLVALMAAELWAYGAKRFDFSARATAVLAALLLVPVLLCSAYTANVYRVIGKIDRQQRSIIAQALENGDGQVYLPAYSPLHQKFVFGAMAEGEYRLGFFKQFYGLDDSVEIIYIEE